jgi:hypothetical protein
LENRRGERNNLPRLPQSKLAGIGKNGRAWVNPHVPKSITIRGKTIDPRAKLRIHERTEHPLIKKFMKLGLSEKEAYNKAHNIALKREHRNMTPHQIAVYEGHNGAVARWHPMRRRR